MIKAFPRIYELRELEGPIIVNNNYLVYKRPWSFLITTIWYKFDRLKLEWSWTPYGTLDEWITIHQLTVPYGFWKDQRPAKPNVKIIRYLQQVNNYELFKNTPYSLIRYVSNINYAYVVDSVATVSTVAPLSLSAESPTCIDNRIETLEERKNNLEETSESLRTSLDNYVNSLLDSLIQEQENFNVDDNNLNIYLENQQKTIDKLEENFGKELNSEQSRNLRKIQKQIFQFQKEQMKKKYEARIQVLPRGN